MTRAIFPGTFDPLHNGHLDIVTRASRIFDEVILSVYDAPPKKLMFTTEERVAMAVQAVRHLPNVSVSSYVGLTIDCARHLDATVIVRGLRNVTDFTADFVDIAGIDRDLDDGHGDGVIIDHTDLATFTEATRRPAAYPAYRHADLQRSFAPVVADLGEIAHPAEEIVGDPRRSAAPAGDLVRGVGRPAFGLERFGATDYVGAVGGAAAHAARPSTAKLTVAAIRVADMGNPRILPES